MSTTAFGAAELSAVLDACRVEGIDAVELTAGVRVDAAARQVLADRASAGTRFLVHNYFPPPADPFVLNLAADEPEVRAMSIAHCEAALELTATLGAPFYSVHAGFAARLSPDDLGRPLVAAPAIPRDIAYANFVEAVAGVCDHAQRLGVRLLVENNVVSPFNLVNGRNERLLLATAEEIVACCEDVSHPALGILVDVGHLKVSAGTLAFDREAFIETVAPWIGAFHLSDNDGVRDTNDVFGAGSWFLPALSRFPDVPCVIECRDLTAAQRRECRELVAGVPQ